MIKFQEWGTRKNIQPLVLKLVLRGRSWSKEKTLFHPVERGFFEKRRLRMRSIRNEESSACTFFGELTFNPPRSSLNVKSSGTYFTCKVSPTETFLRIES